MIFNGINNQFIEIKIINYQFPNVIDDKWESNWLLIYLKVKSNDGNWETTDPALLTFEVKDLIIWFKKLLNNEVYEKYLVFTEPNLEFELVKNEKNLKTVRIHFHLEFLPKNLHYEDVYFVDCEMDNSELKKIISKLENELKDFPERSLK